MNYLKELTGIVLIVATIGMLYLALRRPNEVRLRAVAGMVTAWTIGYPFGRAASMGEWFLGLDPMVCQLIQHATLMLGAYSVVLFFLFSALDDTRARRHALLQTIPLSVAVLVMGLAVHSMPDSLRVQAARVPNSLGGGPVGIESISIFYATGNSYLMFAFATMFVWTRRYARTAEPRLRRGLTLASIGLALMVFADLTFVSGNLARLFGTTAPRPVLTVGSFALLIGFICFLLGVAYPAVLMRAAATRVWTRHLRSYHRLSPLWTMLHARFPEDALSRVPAGRWRDLSLRGVHRRYYRRVIECRDGLVRVSPFLAPDERPLALRLKEALDACADGVAMTHQPVPVAVPDGDGLDADVRELEELAYALRTS
ncbi:hypothetical protein Lesp02_11660 [Lentzea sp. NBRC 105346]|uniref:MAB_1171c family putative transporter n=1 Tax=Lentzea sp. NBRC 105346 TaxID=3032205 RepID=UPI0024A174B2|nr:MAB_1171c family putative transporter [Lentzea sp. NBRC 105346]GLZ28976.1 hypothetical protein Lesp02_11660 [Lentzea sp. NBRC 105346]